MLTLGMSTKIIKYIDLVMNEGGIQIQKGMNFGINTSYSVVLMSVARNAPYNDEMLDDGIIKYEGHDIFSRSIELKKSTDQPMKFSSGALTENGKFFNAAKEYKLGKRNAAKIKVYRKLRPGIWVDMGFYELTDAFLENDGKRNVFKFLLKPIFEDIGNEISENVDIFQQRYIPGKIMQEVFLRDKGKCVVCGSEDNLRYDHKIPYSKGGTSIDSKNIQLLCARHNLRKSNKLLYELSL